MGCCHIAVRLPSTHWFIIPVLLAASGVAAAGTKGGVTFETRYTRTAPDQPTGFETRFRGAPSDAEGRPDPVTRATITFERGTRLDTAVPARCDRATLEQGGPDACPPRSVVGSGTAEAVTGLAALDPIEGYVTVVNAAGGILFHLQGLQNATIEGKVSGNRLTVDVPEIPVPGTAKGAILTRLDLRVRRVRRGRRAYVRTPPSCRRGRWVVRATLEYRNVPPIRRVASVTRCGSR